jgi:predicted ribosomally synthesized peptide with SipW-like signal peptide
VRAAVLALLAVALLVVGSAGTTLAVFTARKTATATIATGTLGKPTVTLAKGTGNSVTVTWTAVSAPGTVTYYVTRDGGEPSGNCPKASAPANVLTCRDTWLSSGTHSYTVTAYYRGWTAVSTAVSIAVTAPTLTFSSKAAADGYIAVTVTGANWTPRVVVTITYAFRSQTQMALAPFGLNPTTNNAGAFTVNWEDDCKDGDGVQQHTDVPAWVWATDGTYSVMATGTMVCSKYTH